MASGYVKKIADRKYQAVWREVAQGSQRKRIFPTKKEADDFLSDTLSELKQGTYVDPKAGRVRFETFAENEWRTKQPQHRASTQARVKSVLATRVYPFLGSQTLDSITPSKIANLVAAWTNGSNGLRPMAPSSIEIAFSYVSAIFALAVEQKKIPKNPCENVKRPKVTKKRVMPLEPETVEAMIDAMDPRYRALVILMAGTGVRQGEAFGLTRDRIDFENDRIRIDRQIDPDRPDGQLHKEPKTEASNRTIPMPKVVKVALSEHLLQFPSGPEGLLFTTRTGAPLRRTSFEFPWRKMREKAGISASVTSHDLRHFYASLLIRAGESVKVVQARLGHASAVETLDTYAHLWPDSEETTRRAIDGVLGARNRVPSIRSAAN